MRVGADTGGTFTDLVADDGRVAKVLSTPADPSQAVAGALAELSPGGPPDVLAHGTTVPTNALLERRGAKVALVTNAGLADVIEIARQDRPSLYDLWADRPEPLVPRDLRLEVPGRLDATGRELEPVDPSSLGTVPEGVEVVAVCLLHADLDGSHERVVADALAASGVDVVCSSDVSPEFREYERTVTTVVNAYLRPRCRGYLRTVAGLAGDVLVMTSAGGLVPAAQAADLPVSLLLSGPAGGVIAGAAAAKAAGYPDAVTFDMGGTSTDVCLVRGGAPEPAPGRIAAGFPIRLPALDIHTIGAGGGSIARIDPGGALVVGPASAGADPGPACYGRGGTEPTVTDADLVLGRIPADAAFPGLGRLDRDAAAKALEAAAVTAEGVVTVVDAGMERAVRRVSVERGVDPSSLALVAFGGAGPLHACAVAGALGMPAVVVPPRAGVLSAVGLLCGPRQRDLVRSWPTPDDHDGLGGALAQLADEARRAVRAGGGAGADVEVSTSVDCRYRGQSHELTVATVADFEDEHRRRNGYARPGAPVEVVAVRARARVRAGIEPGDLPLPAGQERRPTTGPAVLVEADCTVWVPEGWSAAVAGDGSWVITR
ncbi:MAG: hydantoinase/oxoprolinase family protein [Acidimicrobiia bacterium]